MSEYEETNANQEHFIARWGRTIVENAGPGCRGGAYSYPGALDRYEKALGLKPAEAWLVKRLLSFDWDGKKYVWCSLRKISQEADVSYNQVLALTKSLERKGYIRDMGQHGSSSFSQVRDWSIAGLLRALEWAILCDPNSEAGKAKAEALGHPVTMADFWWYADGPQKGQPYEPFLAFTTPKALNAFLQNKGKMAAWDPYYQGTADLPQPQKRELIDYVCSRCGKCFQSGSRNPATRCPKCRKETKRQSLIPLADK